jgi:CRP/FNR family transcriptional regulator, cyclic AMP receptor protein
MSTVPPLQFWYLRNHQIFSQMSDAEIQQMCIMSGFKNGYKNETIYFSDEPLNRIYILKRGMIKICAQDENGSEIIKDIIKEGDVFGELSLNKNNDNHEFAKVISDEVSICSFKVDDFETVLKNNSSISLNYNKMMGDKLKKLENRYQNLVFKDVKSRLKIFLTDWAAAEGQPTDNGIEIKNYLTHQDLAEIICSTRQTVTQLLGELEKEGKLTYSRSKIVLQEKAMRHL